jgi:hypothetical protein
MDFMLVEEGIALPAEFLQLHRDREEFRGHGLGILFGGDQDFDVALES